MNELKKKTSDQIGKLQALLYLCDQYDLLEYKDRLGNINHYYSSKINPVVDKVSIYSACHCCNDAALVARPYIIVNGVTLYPDPNTFTIGHGNNKNGVTPDDNWQDQFVGFNPIIVEIIQEYFDECIPMGPQ